MVELMFLVFKVSLDFYFLWPLASSVSPEAQPDLSLPAMGLSQPAIETICKFSKIKHTYQKLPCYAPVVKYSKMHAVQRILCA